MLDSDSGLLTNVLDVITGDVASSVLNKIKSYTSSSSLAITIKEKLSDNHLHSEISKIIRESSTLANQAIDLKSKTIKHNIENNKELIVDWIISDQSKYSLASQMEKIDIIYEDYEIEKELIPRYFKNLYNYISIKKEEYLSIGVKSILSEISSINFKIDQQTNILLDNRNLLLSMKETLYPTFSLELKEARELLNIFNTKSARDIAFTIQKKIEKSNNKEEKEELYRIIADSYLMIPDEQTKAVEWIKKLIDLSDSISIKQRRKALLLILEKNEEEAEKILDQLLLQPECEEHVHELKCNILLKQHRGKEGLDFLKKVESCFKKTEYWNAQFQILNNDFKMAIQYAEKAVKRKKSYQNRKLLFDAKIMLYDRKFSLMDIDDNDFEEIKNLTTEADELLSLIDNNLPSEKSDILTKKGILFNCLGKINVAKELYNEAYNTYKNNPALLKNRAIMLWPEDPQESVKNLDILLNIIPDDINLKYLRFEILKTYNSEQAISELKTKLKEQDHINYKILLVESLYENNDNQEAETLIAEIEEQYGSIPKLILVKANILEKKNKIDDSILLLEKHFDKMIGFLKPVAVDVLSSLYMRKNETIFLKKSITLLQPFSNYLIRSPLLLKYVQCLYYLQEWEKCLDICCKIRSVHEEIADFVNYEASIYLHTENFSKAIPLFETLKRKSIKNTLLINLNLAYCYFRLGDTSKANNIVELSISDTLLADDLVLISNIYNSFGKAEEAVNLAYKAYQKEPEDQGIIENFISCILFSRKHNLILNDNIKNAYHNCLNTYEEKFPYSVFLKKITIPEKSEDLLLFLQKMLSDSKQQFDKSEEIYMAHKLPVSILSKAVGRDYITTWHSLIQNKKLAVWSESGNIQELNSEIEIAYHADKCILDFHIILSLYELGLLELVSKIFSRIFISQSIIDLLMNEIIKLESSGQNQTGFLIMDEEEQVRFFDISKTEIENKTIWIDQLLSTLKKTELNFEIVGQQIKTNIPEKLEKIFLSMQDVESSAIKYFINSGIPLALGNSTIRTLLRLEKFNYNGSFGITSILNKLLMFGVITREVYLEKSIWLVLHNHKHISFNKDLLLYEAEKNGFVLNNEVLQVFGQFSDEFWNIDSCLEVLIQFVVTLISKPIPVEIIRRFSQLAISMFTKRIDINDDFWSKYFKPALNNQILGMTGLWGKRKIQLFLDMIENIEIQGV